MRTTVVPAQITTVEDRIAGNFTFTQIILLVIPLITSTAVYVAIPPRSGFSAIKVVLIGLQFLLFGSMAIRIRGKLIVDWLVILLRFKFRPRVYVFTKCDEAGRDVIEIVEDKKKADSKQVQNEQSSLPAISLGEQARIKELFDNHSLNFRFELAKKGGIDVSLAAKED